MLEFIPADNQAIVSRPLGDAVWITSLITPQNPDVMLKYEDITRDCPSREDRINALWRYVAELPYRKAIRTRFSADSKSSSVSDAWLFPSETLKVRHSNCANRSFLLASLLKNELMSPGDVYCILGNLELDSIGAHAWVMVNLHGRQYILESTQPLLEEALLPASELEAYHAVVAFNENAVYTVEKGIDPEVIVNASFGFCQIDFLRAYICRRCLSLEV